MIALPFGIVVPDTITFSIAGLILGINVGAYVIRRRYMQFLDFKYYSDADLSSLVDWALEELKFRELARKPQACECGDKLSDCSTCPQNPGVDSHEEKK